MTTLAELVAATPAYDRGVVTQLNSGTGTWRLVVELADPSAGTSVAWYDITTLVQGIDHTRGADQYAGRYRSTVVELLVDAGDDDALAPWNDLTTATFGTHVQLGPGLLIRAGLIRVDGTSVLEWLPRFTARVERWGDATYARGNIRLHPVTCRDVFGELLNEPVAAASSENWVDRIDHVLTEAAWPFGSTVYGVETDNLAAAMLTFPAADEADNALLELDATVDPAGCIWYTTRTGDIIVRPNIGDTWHADEFDAGGTGTEWTDPATVLFSVDAELDGAIGIVLDDGPTPFGIEAVEQAVVNRIRVTDPTPATYDTDDPTSQQRYGNRTRNLSWRVANDDVADDMLARLAYAVYQATPLETEIDQPGYFPAAALLDFLAPVQVKYRTAAGRIVVTATGVVRQIVERIAPRGANTIEWQQVVTFDVDNYSLAYDLDPVESLAVSSNDHDSAVFTWTNPTQTPAPTETWYRIPELSSIWVEDTYPLTGTTYNGLEPDTTYQLDVRLVRRVDGLIVAFSPIESVQFTTDPDPAGDLDPDGAGGLTGTLPDDGACTALDWVLESSDDGSTWSTVASGSGNPGDVLTFSGVTWDSELTYRLCSTCTSPAGTEYCTPVSVVECVEAPDYAAAGDPYDRTDLLMFVPEACPPDLVVEAVSGRPGVHGPAWGGLFSVDAGDVALASDTAAGGIIALGDTPALDYTGAATIGIRASVQTVETARLFGIAGLRLDAVAGTTGWYPRASVTTIFGDEATVTDTTERALITPLDLFATYNADTGVLQLFVDDLSVGTDSVEEAAPRAAAGDYWHVGAPAASWVTNAAAWSSVLPILPDFVATDWGSVKQDYRPAGVDSAGDSWTEYANSPGLHLDQVAGSASNTARTTLGAFARFALDLNGAGLYDTAIGAVMLANSGTGTAMTVFRTSTDGTIIWTDSHQTSGQLQMFLVGTDAADGTLRIIQRLSGGTIQVDDTGVDVCDGNPHIVTVIRDGAGNVQVRIDGVEYLDVGELAANLGCTRHMVGGRFFAGAVSDLGTVDLGWHVAWSDALAGADLALAEAALFYEFGETL